MLDFRGTNEKQGRRAEFNYHGAKKELRFFTREVYKGRGG
jgi:hypothetical protein